MKIPRASEGGLLAAILLSFLATAGFFYVNIMPAIVSGLVDGLHFSPRDAGRIGAANMYGTALGALLAVWLTAWVSWRRLAVLALCALIAVDLFSMTLHTPIPLASVRFAHGVIGGALVGTAFSVIARTPVPDRTFGMLLLVQFGLGGVGVMFLPGLVPMFGARVLFLSLAAFSALTLLIIPFLSDYPPRLQSRLLASANTSSTPGGLYLSLALLAVFLYQAANMSVTAYSIELGRGYGLATREVTATLGLANWIGASGSVLVITLGLKWGRLRPLLAAIVISIVGTMALHLSARGAVFAAANIATAIAWSFGIPYLLGLCAAFDRNGRSATLASLFSKLGLASGPFAASMLVGSGKWGLLINLASLALLASALFALPPAARLDQNRTAEPEGLQGIDCSETV